MCCATIVIPGRTENHASSLSDPQEPWLRFNSGGFPGFDLDLGFGVGLGCKAEFGAFGMVDLAV